MGISLSNYLWLVMGNLWFKSVTFFNESLGKKITPSRQKLSPLLLISLYIAKILD